MPARSPLRFLFQFFRGSLHIAVFSILLSTAAILLGVGLIGTSAYLISYAALQPSISVLSIPIVGVRFFGIAKSLFRYMERLASHDVNFRILADLRLWIYRRIIPRVPFQKSTDRTGDLLSRAVEDVEVLEFFFIRVINPPLAALMTSLVVSLFLGGFHLRLGWIYLLLSVGSILISLAASYAVVAISSRDHLQKQADLHTSLVDYLDGLPDLIVNQSADDQLGSIQSAERVFTRSQVQASVGNGLINGLLLLLANASMLVILCSSIILVDQGEMDSLLLAVTTLVTLVSFEGIQLLNLAAQQLHLSRQAGQRILALSGDEMNGASGDGEALVRAPQTNQPTSIPELEISGVSFHYPGNPAPVLEDIQLTISPGSKIAIVGPSGAGKTSLARLLLGFWKPSKGNLSLDGKLYGDIPEAEIRDSIGYSGPGPYFFNTSIRENFSLLRPALPETEILKVLEQVQLKSWYASLSNGLDTLVGERGLKMSEGERRRLDLARLLLLNRPILILDEPYANQDIQTQTSLSAVLRDVTRAKTVILITHRLFELDTMDEIITLNNGQIEERGNQAALLARNGLFAEMWNQQHQILPEA